MKILHLLSQTQVTGAEVYAATLANMQIAEQHNVYILSDTFNTATTAQYEALPLDTRTFAQRIKNVIAVRRFIREKKIDIVHAHSRATSWVGYFATRCTKIPLVSSIHGFQKPSLSKKFWNMYGERLITICADLKQQLTTQLKINPRHVQTIPNGFDFSQLPTRQAAQQPTLVIAGRMTGPKGEGIAALITQVLPVILEKLPTLHIKIFGGQLNMLSTVAQDAWQQLILQYPQQCIWGGFVNDLPQQLANASVVIGAGRIAVEALAIGIPTIALGEAACLGLVDERTIEHAITTNFGDIIFPKQGNNFSASEMIQQIIFLLQHPMDANSTLNIQQKIQAYFDLAVVYPAIIEVYAKARMEKTHRQHIPILMYHKVLPEPEVTRHRTFVTVKQFDQHMRFLARHHFTPITFTDYFAFRDGQQPLANFPRKPIIITFDDGYVNNLTLALPVLKKYGFKAVLYALGDVNLDHNQWDAQHGEPKHELLDAAGLQAMSAAGIEIGAHSMTHAKLPKLTADAAWQEIWQSKQNLEELLQKPVISFAYPYGDYNDEIKALTQKAGYRCAVATDRGGLVLEDDCFAIFRVNIMPRDHAWEIFKKTRASYRQRYWRKRGQ